MKKFRTMSYEDKLFYIIITILLSFIFLAVLYPIIYVLAASFSSGTAVSSGKVILWPVDFSLEGYKTVFNTSSVFIGYRNSIFYTAAGTGINIIITMMAAATLSRKDLPGRNGIMLIFTFTMFFNGGIITNYMLVKSLRILNTVWALLLPGALGVYNLIIAKTFIQNSIPDELMEAGKIDGCSDIQHFLRIVLPLSKAIIAVLVLFYGLAHWNAYFNAMIYLNNRELYPLTIFLKEILIAGQIDPGTVTDPELQAKLAQTAAVIKYALIVVSMVPVMILYPFIQKYFVKGVMIGAIKG